MRAASVFADTAVADCSPTQKSPASSSASGSGQPAQDGSADFVFHDGPIYTVAEKNPWAKGLAVKGNTITYDGDDAGAMALAGAGTQVVDLNGKLLHANTLGAAYQIRLDDKVGSLEVGKLADLIVLGENIFELDVHDIHNANVAMTMTMTNGKVRHQA